MAGGAVETTGSALMARFNAKHGPTIRQAARRREQSLQIACVQLLDIYQNMKLLRFTHVPNGGKRSKAEAGIFKAMGVRAGFPDLIILPRNRRAGIILAELKAEDGALAKSQIEWRDWLLESRYTWAEIRSIDQLKALLIDKGVI